MDNKINETFDMIHAEEYLKNSTKEYLARKTGNYGRNRRLPARRFTPVLACASLLLLFVVGYRTFFTATSVISLDINPSLELNLNRFDRVISVVPYNDDGRILAASVNVRFLDYRDALNKILESKTVSALLAQDELLSIVVADSDERQCQKILAGIASCTSEHENTLCYSAARENVTAAHSHGLSCGKYSTLLKIQEIYPNITAEDIRDMTMRELQNLLQSPPSETPGSGHHPEHETYPGNGHHGGSGSGHGHHGN